MMSLMKRTNGLPFLVVLLILLVTTAVSAQTKTPDAPAPAREIYLVLGLGDPVFEAESWLASAAERADRTTATWTSSEFGALGYAEYLHFSGGYEANNLVSFFDDEWFAVAFKDYDAWERTARCSFDTTLLHEFALQMGDQAYVMRYWIQPVTPTRVLALHLVFPTGRTDLLDSTSQRFAPLAWQCPR